MNRDSRWIGWLRLLVHPWIGWFLVPPVGVSQEPLVGSRSKSHETGSIRVLGERVGEAIFILIIDQTNLAAQLIVLGEFWRVLYCVDPLIICIFQFPNLKLCKFLHS